MTLSPEAVEAVARAIYADRYKRLKNCHTWDELLSEEHGYADVLNFHLQIARAAIAAMQPVYRAAEEMREALKVAREDVAHWGSYASDYFKEKHDLAGDLAAIDAALARAQAKE